MRRRWGAFVASDVVLVAVLAGPAPASALLRSWYGELDSVTGLAGNLNSPVVVAVGRPDGHVRYRDTGASGWHDIGAAEVAGEPRASVKWLATSAGWIYAARTDGQLFGWAPDTRVWEHLRDGIGQVLASRHLTMARPGLHFQSMPIAVVPSGT